MQALDSKVFNIVGWNGSGRAALASQLVRFFSGRDLSVSVVRQDTSRSETSENQSDDTKAGQLLKAGCREVILASSDRWALYHAEMAPSKPVDHAGQLATMTAKLTPVDLILAIGFKASSQPKLLLVHPEDPHALQNTELLLASLSNVQAIVTTDALATNSELPQFSPWEIAPIAELISMRCGL